MTNGERDWLKLQDSFISLSLYLKICTADCSFLSFFLVSELHWCILSLRWDLLMLYLCISWDMIFIYIILVACGLEKMCNECYVWHTCVVFIFIRTMHARIKIFDVMPLYLFLCDIFVICITVLLCHTHMHPMDAMI